MSSIYYIVPQNNAGYALKTLCASGLSPAVLTFSMKKRLLDVVRGEGGQQYLKQPENNEKITLSINESNKNRTQYTFIQFVSIIGKLTFHSHISTYFLKGNNTFTAKLFPLNNCRCAFYVGLATYLFLSWFCICRRPWR